MEEKKLYPLKFVPLKDEYVWGTEEFLLADLGYRDSFVLDGWLASNTLSEVLDTYLDSISGEKVFEWYGKQFPVYVKRITVKGRMPLRVNPDDETASTRYDSLGKDKIWYVEKCGKDARIALGFRDTCEVPDFCKGCSDGSIEQRLNFIAPHAGQVLHIEPGTVHYAQGELDIVEISEASALDFCLCTWGQETGEEEFDPSLNLIEALDFTDFGKWVGKSQASRRKIADNVEQIAELQAFTTGRIDLANPLKINAGDSDSFAIYYCVKGKADILYDINGQTMTCPVPQGEVVLVCAETREFTIVPEEKGTVLLETSIPEIKYKDPYINPDAEATLPYEE